jgi:predicted ATPase
MLTRIEIQGYRSLYDVHLGLSPLTVLIGPNGSGKSNFLDFFALMSEAASGKLSEGVANRGGINTLLYKGGANDIFVRLDFAPEAEFEDERSPVHYKLQLRPVGALPFVWFEQVSKQPTISTHHSNALYLMHRSKDNPTTMFRSLKTGQREELDLQEQLRAGEGKEIDSQSELAIFQVKDKAAYPTPYKVLNHLEGWTFYRPIRVGPDAPIRIPQLARSGLRLFPDGSNLSSVLQAIQSQYPAIWNEICELIGNVYEDFRYLSFPAQGDGKIILNWWEHPFERDYGFSANLLSDGTLRFLCLLAILKTPDPPPLICLDEPELGLHPDWIKVVAELLEAAAMRTNNPTQIIVSTHSPELVSHVKPDHVVVVEKANGQTSLTRLADEDLSAWLEKFRLGELWLAGHLGGRP